MNALKAEERLAVGGIESAKHLSELILLATGSKKQAADAADRAEEDRLSKVRRE